MITQDKPTMHYVKHILFTIALSGCLSAQGNDKASDSQQLQALLQPISSLSAQFEQQVIDANGLETQRAAGLLYLAQPNKLRWVVSEPMPQQLISDGQTLWLYDEDLEQVVVQPVDSNIDSTPIMLFSGDLQRLNHTYSVLQTSKGVFELTPKKNDSLIASIRLDFNDKIPTSLAMTDNLDQITRINLTNLSVNREIPADLFTFKIPDDTDVIRND